MERFTKGRRYRFREFKRTTDGPPADDDAVFVYRGDGIFEPVIEKFVDGETYTFAQIGHRVWSDEQRDVDPEARFVYRADARGFEEIEPPSPFALVPAQKVRGAVEALVSKGLTTREIARVSGVSIGAAERAAAGHGFVRYATAAALEAAAANGNGR
jgi:hypothetical protein